MLLNNAKTMSYIVPLPTRPKLACADPIILPGHRCFIQTTGTPSDRQLFQESMHNGLIGDYQIRVKSTQLDAIDLNAHRPHGFIWDPALLSPALRQRLIIDPEQPQSVLANQLSLLNTSLDAPAVNLIGATPTLMVTPRFDLIWTTAAYASQLGVVQLVESSRIAHFADGASAVIRDTEALNTGPVLFLSDPADSQPVKPVCPFQAQDKQQRLTFTSTVTQPIPAQWAGKAVTSISVLEKFTLYFMQNAAPDQPEHCIWVPMHLPIVWGWSIRVQQRYDGVWDIFRKKLILPQSSTEAPALPLWQNNSLA